MKTLVTEGTEFLGRHVVNRLKKEFTLYCYFSFSRHRFQKLYANGETL